MLPQMESRAVADGRAATPHPGRRVLLALGIATAIVVLVVTLVPRSYIANDDIGFTEYLRTNLGAPWISSILARGFGFAYAHASGVPWWGLYQYALVVVIGAVLIHTCLELIDQRPGLSRKVTWIGAVVLGASHAILVIGLTWTTVSISALGTSMVALAAHARLCQVAARPMSSARSLGYGVLFAAGYMLRPQGLGAMVLALAPALGWAAWRFLKARHFPRRTALLAFAAPFALVLGLQPRFAPAPDPAFDEFNSRRGQLHGQAAYERLDTRAPELLERAGWSRDEYRDFMSWLIVDERDYPPAKLDRLLATGGVPEVASPGWASAQLRVIVEDSTASVLLFLTAVIAGLLLAWLGAIDRLRGAAFCVGYVAWLVALPLWMAEHLRFPQRVSLSIYTLAALGVFLYLAWELSERTDAAPPVPRTQARIGQLVIAGCLAGWGWHLATWLHREPPAYRKELQELDDRIAARGGFVFVYVQTGLVDLDPLRARPRGYDGLQGGWGTFSKIWYHSLEPLGVRRGSDVLGAMIDNRDAYLLAPVGMSAFLQSWIARKVGNPDVRFALVDVADIPSGGRPGLYQLVTTPLTHDSAEWKVLLHDEQVMLAGLPGPPRTDDRRWRAISFAAPFAQHAAPRPGAEVAPIDHGVRYTASDDRTDDCATGEGDAWAELGHVGGIKVALDGLGAAKFDLKLIDPENIVTFNVDATTRTSRAVRWRWQLSPVAQELGYAGTISIVPGYAAHQLALAVDTARAEDVRELRLSLVVKPGTRAGFELRNLSVAPP